MLFLIRKLVGRVRRIYWALFVRITLQEMGVSFAGKVIFFGWPVVSKAVNSKIHIGHNVTICSDSSFTALGVRQPCVFRTLNPKANIYIGDDTGVSGASICAADSVVIGKGCLIGSGVIIADTDFHSLLRIERRYCGDLNLIKSRPVSIGNNVFIGAGAIILKGVFVGDDSVIGAGSVVVKSVPAGTIVAGNPARIIGKAVYLDNPDSQSHSFNRSN